MAHFMNLTVLNALAVYETLDLWMLCEQGLGFDFGLYVSFIGSGW